MQINGTTDNAGEFRGGKCLSVIWGVHENGNVYTRVNDVPPISGSEAKCHYQMDPYTWITRHKIALRTVFDSEG